MMGISGLAEDGLVSQGRLWLHGELFIVYLSLKKHFLGINRVPQLSVPPPPAITAGSREYTGTWYDI